MIRLPEYDRFLTASEVGGLSSSVLDELVDLYDDATSTVHRATTRERLKAGDLQVPCIRLKYAQTDFVLDIDMVLIDAAVRARATLAGRGLDSSGRPCPQEEKQNNRQKLEVTTGAMEKDVDNPQQLARASQPHQAIVKEMIAQPKQELGPSSVEPPVSLASPPTMPSTQKSPGNRGREESDTTSGSSAYRQFKHLQVFYCMYKVRAAFGLGPKLISLGVSPVLCIQSLFE
ncbi:hypothetical protein FRC01_009032 [Tulasnella sp. 417]|nr:hypothetical protein FRC01_009032 [Tulasnella sp. 417]